MIPVSLRRHKMWGGIDFSKAIDNHEMTNILSHRFLYVLASQSLTDDQYVIESVTKCH
jgi:hypothetical protein